MKILAIETSCDETAIALVEAKGNPSTSSGPKFRILENLVASQIKIHRPFGGIVPTLAKREHLKNLPILYRKIFGNPKSEIRNSKQTQNSKFKTQNIDLIAVTVGPGLEPALWTGINFAKEIYKEIRKLGNKEIKLIGASHLDGHLYSFLLSQKRANPKSQILNPKTLFPAIALLVSGGHTILLKMDSLTKYKKLGETRDDAVGEAFDKVARLLGLPYPGGPEIEKLAKYGGSTSIDFPRPMIDQKNYDFSFSGLKTSVLYFLRDNKPVKKGDVAASFQKAAFDVLISKSLRAAKEFSAKGGKAKSIMISGGVASNNSLRNYLKLRIKNEELRINLIIPPKKFCLDNAAMIAAAGYINHLRRKKRKLVANGNLTICIFN